MSNLLEIDPDKVSLARIRCVHANDQLLSSFVDTLIDKGFVPDVTPALRLCDAGSYAKAHLELLSSGCSDDEGDAMEAATRPGRWDGEANAIG